MSMIRFTSGDEMSAENGAPVSSMSLPRVSPSVKRSVACATSSAPSANTRAPHKTGVMVSVDWNGLTRVSIV